MLQFSVAYLLLLTCIPQQALSQLSEGTIPWGCGRFNYYNATWNEAEIPGIIEQALFEVDNYLEYLYTIEGVPSISFGVVYGNDLIHYYSIGATDLNDTSSSSSSSNEPSKDTIYRIGSVSKVWSTLMAFIMRDEGEIHLDSPVSDYNSNFSIRNPWGIDNSEQFGQKITLKHLASQVSGLPREAPCLNTTTEESCYLEDTNTILQRLSDDFYLIHPTDTQASYSNLAYALLGNIVSEYVNLTYEQALNKYVIDPLGATHTGLYLSSEQSKYAAVGYNSDVVQPWTDIGWLSPAGQLFSSINDLSLLMSQYFAAIPSKYSLNDDSYIDNIINNFDFITYPTTFREMLRPVFINPDLETGFGSPWEMQSMNNGGIKKWIKSKGGNIYGFSSNMAMIPEMRLGTIGLINDEVDGSLFSFGPLEILYKAFEAWLIAMESEYKPQMPSSPSIYEGDYYLDGSYLFTIELTTLNSNDWLMLYGFSSGIYGTLIYYTDDTTGGTFVFLNTQINVQSCWITTLDALDGTTFLFDISQNAVQGVELIDNDYGDVFSQSSSSSSHYFEKREKRTYDVNNNNNEKKKMMDEDISMLFRKNHALQTPSTNKRGKRGNAGRNLQNKRTKQFSGFH